MNYTNKTPTNAVLASVAKLINKIQFTVNKHYSEEKPELIPPQINADVGTAFVRIYQHNITTNREFTLCFVMLDTGVIRMPLGLKAFDKFDAGCVLDVMCENMITSDGFIKAPDGTPSSFDPTYRVKPISKPIRRSIPNEYDTSPEAELARQRAYGNRNKKLDF